MNELILKIKRPPSAFDGLYEVVAYWRGEELSSQHLALETHIQRRGSLEAVEKYLNSKKGFRFAMGESKESYMKYVRMREYAKRQPPSIGW